MILFFSKFAAHTQFYNLDNIFELLEIYTQSQGLVDIQNFIEQLTNYKRQNF